MFEENCKYEYILKHIFRGVTCIVYCIEMSYKYWGWSGGAKVLGKLSVPGRPTSLDYSRARAYCACSSSGWGFVWTLFLSSIFSLFFLPLFGRRPDIDGMSQRTVKPKTT